MRRAALLVLLAPVASLPAQAPPGPTRALDSIVVTVERVPLPLSHSTAAVTRLSGEALARLPQVTLADLLRLAPGFALRNTDGVGAEPHVMVRGFYGGGEAEYVVVLVDGRPVNQFHSGVVAWDALPPLAAIASIEIIRGGASALYGDAALGGIIQVTTRTSTGTPVPRWALSAGSFDSWRFGLDAHPQLGGRTVAVSGGIDRTGGFRDHGDRANGRLSVRSSLVQGSATRLVLDLGSMWREFEDPGPLLDELLSTNRTGSDPLFRFDETSDRRHRVALDASHELGRSGALSGNISAEYQRVGAVRTIALAPGFGDTKDRDLRHHRVGGAMQWQAPAGALPGGGTAIIGGELSRSGVTSRYFQVATGTRDDYAAVDGTRGDLDAHGTGNRVMGALFAQYATHSTGPVRLSLGLRFDWLRDEFETRLPGEPARRTASHRSLSPKAGINVRYLDRERQSGHFFLAASRSFKAPTPDQLFDQRSVPVPFPPYAITTSNPDLVPQHGTSLEGGVYHGVEFSPATRLDASLAVYTMAMRDELDFDVATLRYVNIGRSRHRGIEAGLTLSSTSGTTLFGNYTLQSAQSRTGATAGRQLKSVPRHTLHAGMSVAPAQALQLGLSATSVHGVYLDDANAVPLRARTTVDGRAGYRIGAVELVVDIRNLFAEHFASGGYLDPSGSGAVYYYPTAGRTLDLGLRSGW